MEGYVNEKNWNSFTSVSYTHLETVTHNELLANGEIYSNMWRAHMSVKDSEQEVEPRA